MTKVVGRFVDPGFGVFLGLYLAGTLISASEASRSQGSGGAAPSGVQGRSPGGGLGGRSPPDFFWQN